MKSIIKSTLSGIFFCVAIVTVCFTIIIDFFHPTLKETRISTLIWLNDTANTIDHLWNA